MTDAPPKREPIFSIDEYQQRLEALRNALKAQELDALILTDPANIAWAIGYDIVAHEAPSAAIIFGSEAPKWWGSTRDLAAAEHSVWMATDQLAAYEEVDGRHPFEDLGRRLGNWGLRTSRIGVELDSAGLSAAAMGALIHALSSARYVDATGLADIQRLVKSPTEIDLMRRAATRADAAQDAALAALRPDAAVDDVLAACAAVLGPSHAVAPTLLMGGAIAGRALAPGRTAVQAGTPAALILAGAAAGYVCPIARSMHLGAPDGAIADAATAAADAFDAALAVAKPGAPVGEIADALFKVLGDRPANPQAMIGFSVGLARPPRWRERNLRVMRGADTELLEGMALWLSIGPAELGAPLRIDETILITSSGAEALAQTPRELAVKA